MKKFIISTALAVSLLALPAAASAAVFTFEGASVGAGLTTLAQTDAGLTMTVTRPGSVFEIIDLTPFSGPASFGARTLGPSGDTGTSTPFVASFSAGVNTVSMNFGDFGADSDTASLSLWSGLNGTGSLLGTANVSWGAADFSIGNPPGFITLTSALSALSATFIIGSPSFPQSGYFDNITATASESAVPELATWAMMISGFGLVGAMMRRRRLQPVRA